MNLIEILSILGIHWFADFVCQTDKQAKGKSKNWKDLIDHTQTYAMIWWTIGLIILIVNLFYPFFVYQGWGLTLFVFITFICHTATDYFTSRINSRLWEAGKVHNFFVSVGFDQYLHYIQLFVTYYLITKYY
jgi:hypothetical protein